MRYLLILIFLFCAGVIVSEEVSTTTPQPIPPVPEVVLRLNDQELNYIMNMLSDQPLKEVLPLWQKILEQIQEQRKPTPILEKKK
jgi:hypothetical protein